MKRHNSAFEGIVNDLANADTPIPGRGWGEAAKIVVIIPLAGATLAIGLSLKATTNAAAWDIFRYTMGDNLELTAKILVAWVLVALHTERVVLHAAGFLYNALIDWRTGSEVEFEIPAAPEPKEEPPKADPEPMIRDMKWSDVDTYVAKVLLWREHEDRLGKTSWRQELARDWGYGSIHEGLTQLLVDAGALIDYGPKRKGDLVILNRGEIMRRISLLK